MPSFQMQIPHGLGRETARQRLQDFMDRVRSRNDVTDLEDSWVGDVLNFSFKTFGFKIEGATTVEDDSVRMDGKLPLAAAPFRGRIEGQIEDELKRMLS